MMKLGAKIQIHIWLQINVRHVRFKMIILVIIRAKIQIFFFENEGWTFMIEIRRENSTAYLAAKVQINVRFKTIMFVIHNAKIQIFLLKMRGRVS